MRGRKGYNDATPETRPYVAQWALNGRLAIKDRKLTAIPQAGPNGPEMDISKPPQDILVNKHTRVPPEVKSGQYRK